MTESVIARTAALLHEKLAKALIGALMASWLTVACTTDGQPAETAVPVSAVPLDLAALNRKAIKIDGMEEDSYPGSSSKSSTYPMSGYLVVLGNTVIWDSANSQGSQCVLKGESNKSALLYTLNQPRSSVRIPCERQRKISQLDSTKYIETLPADVTYSSSMSVQGNVLELSGERKEHSSETYQGEDFTVTSDIIQRQHLKLRIAGDKCQVLEFADTADQRQLNSSTGLTSTKRSMRATRCSIESR